MSTLLSEILIVALLGIVQGLTEFLPVSSTGHLVLLRQLVGMPEAGLFLDTMLHLGTLVAVVVVFWQDVLYMIRRPTSRLTLLVGAGTVVTAVLGLALEDTVERISQTGSTLGWEFLATGFILWTADRIRARGTKEMDDITLRDAVIIGALQGAALLPAISRSGLTIAGALYCGIRKETAARFSFLLSVPAIAGAVVLQGAKLVQGEVESVGTIPLAAGVAAAAVSGYVAVRLMLRILRTGSLKGFAVYVWALGIGVLLAQFFGRL